MSPPLASGPRLRRSWSVLGWTRRGCWPRPPNGCASTSNGRSPPGPLPRPGSGQTASRPAGSNRSSSTNRVSNASSATKRTFPAASPAPSSSSAPSRTSAAAARARSTARRPRTSRFPPRLGGQGGRHQNCKTKPCPIIPPPRLRPQCERASRLASRSSRPDPSQSLVRGTPPSPVGRGVGNSSRSPPAPPLTPRARPARTIRARSAAKGTVPFRSPVVQPGAIGLRHAERPALNHGAPQQHAALPGVFPPHKTLRRSWTISVRVNQPPRSV
jgi:hypothetical protein